MLLENDRNPPRRDKLHAMKICSLLPSATEILFALGLGDQVAGVSHECDFPPEARTKPVLIVSRISHTENAAAIDRQVREFLDRGESLYSVDLAALGAIEPDLIITQDLCHVCAATPARSLSRMARSAIRRGPLGAGDGSASRRDRCAGPRGRAVVPH